MTCFFFKEVSLIAAEHQHNSHSVVEPFVFTGVGPRQHKGRENGKRIGELKLSDSFLNDEVKKRTSSYDWH